MVDSIAPGLYRTSVALPGHEDAFPRNALVFIGQRADGTRFIVRPTSNRHNRWYWTEPVLANPPAGWLWTLLRLPPEGFYTLPETIELGNGGRWVKNAIVQLGYNEAGRAILFIAEEREGENKNALFFSDRGRLIEDELMERLTWAPILPVPAVPLVDPN